VWSLALHGLQALAVVWLMLSARRHDPGLLTLRQSQAFVCGCAAYAAGALSQAAFGPREHLTTLALGVFAALLLRYLYIEYGLLGIRAVEKSSYRMLMFHRTTTQIKSTLDEREVCEILLDGLQTNLGAESAAVFLCDEKREFLRARLVLGPFPPPLPLETKPQGERELRQAIQAMRVPVGEGVVGGVAATGRPAYFYDADQPSPDRPAQPFHTAIVLPLHKLNQVFGVVAVVNRRNGGSFTEDDVRFMGLVLEHASLALANARLQEQMLRSERTFEQLRVAREIQLRLIPSALPDAPGLQSHAMYRPANEVGGDYYDLYRLDDHRVGIVVADVSGKGVPAAIIMAIASTALKTLAPAEGSPCQCLMRLNATLRGEVRRGMFVTVAYAVIDLRTRAMRLACAGHEPVLLCSPSAGASAFLRPKGPALGLLPPERFELAIAEETRTLEPGDALFFYTDGVTEALEPAQPEAGKQRLRDLAIQHGGETPQAMVERVRRAIEERAGPATQGDDITIVALQVVGPPATPTPASPAGAESAAAAGSPAPASGP
jgi:sigma-B regulation protein RsbU (phosphoserine phosphatase)